MRLLVKLELLAIFIIAVPQANADWGNQPTETQVQAVPTTPQVPVPQDEAGRLPAPAGPTQISPCQPAKNCNGPNQCCADKRNCFQKLYAWVTYRPSSGDALPLLRIPPYTSPYTGTFVCNSVAGPSCPGGNCNNGCGKKAACGTVTPPQPIVPEGKPAPVPMPVNTLPQVNEGFPTRGIKGGSVSWSDPGSIGELNGTGDARGINVIPRVGPALPPRGCQGGSIPSNEPSAQGQTNELPQVIESRSQGSPISVETVQFKTVSYTPDASLNVTQTVFIAAMPVSRQLQSPTDLITRSNTRP